MHKALFGCPLPLHSSLITHSLITYHSKHPNLIRWHVWHLFPTSNNSKYFTFCGSYYLSTMLGSLLAYPPHTHSHLILFFPFSLVTLPKPLTNPVKEINHSNLRCQSPPSPTSCASSPNVTRSPPTCSGATDLLHLDLTAPISYHGNVL